MDALNVSNLVVDANGRVSFSGLTSGIDFANVVDQIIEAKRIPVVTLDNRVTENDAKITALNDLRGLLDALRTSVSEMRGAVTVGGAGNVFENKQAFATTSRSDAKTPSAAGNLIGVTVANAADAGSHTMEVRRIAKAHKISSSSFASQSTALGISGDFTITNGANNKVISVAATDTLADIRSRINNANTGTNATGVTASIVTVSATENILVLSNDTTGTALNITDSGSALSGLGISSDNGATFTNVLQTPQTARFTVDGLTDGDHHESAVIASQTATLNNFATAATYPGTFDIVGTATRTISYTASDTLSTLRDKINLETGNTGVTATIVADGDGFRLNLDSGSDFTLTDTSGLLAGLNVNDKLVVENTSNTVSNVFAGLTINLFQSEPGTEIRIDIEQDLTAVKTSIEGFVAAYNAVREFINTQNQVDLSTGLKGDNSGDLFGESILNSTRDQLNALVGVGVAGVSQEFSVLAQIGVDFFVSTDQTNVLQDNTLEIDNTKLDESLLKNIADVRRLFAFDFSSSDPDVALLGFTKNTTYSASGYTLNIGAAGPGKLTSKSVVSATAVLTDAVNSIGATAGAQSFQLNGNVVNYDASVDTLQSIAGKINDLALTGVSASVVGSSGSMTLQVTSTVDPLTTSGDTGDLVSKMTFVGSNDFVKSANIGGAAAGTDNGTVSISGQILTVKSTSAAEGLQVFYDGAGNKSGITLNFTTGVASSMFSTLDSMLDSVTGTIQNEIDTMADQNEQHQTRIDEMLVRLETLRDSLTARFVRAETAMASAENLLESIRQTTEALISNNN